MRLLLCTLLSLLLLCTAHASFRVLPDSWAHEWAQNGRLIVSWKLPYKWGGESKKEGGFDCTGFLWASAPDIWKLKTKAKRSTSKRMEQGLDGWMNQPVNEWNVQIMDIGFIPGHAFAISEYHGLMGIMHSRSSTGPIEEPLPKWIAKENPKHRRLIIEYGKRSETQKKGEKEWTGSVETKPTSQPASRSWWQRVWSLEWFPRKTVKP